MTTMTISTFGIEQEGRELERALLQVRGGVMSFDTFAVQTKNRWERLARMLMRRWSPPSAVSEDDLVQELLLGAWLVLPKYNPKRGTSLERFVVWQATNRAKYWLHVQRGACMHGNFDTNPSRFDVVTETGDVLDREVLAAQEEVVNALERLRLAAQLVDSQKARLALEAVLKNGSVDTALEQLASAGTPVARKTMTKALRTVKQQWQLEV